METKLSEQIKYLRLSGLLDNWDKYLEHAERKQLSYDKFLRHVIDQVFLERQEKARLVRIKKAQIPEMRVINTYPFAQQPKLPQKRLMDIYDTLSYMTKPHDIVWVGPTGVGKSGLATSFLVHAINHGYTGRFVDFTEFIEELGKAIAAGTYTKLIQAVGKFDVLVIDEMGYTEVDANQASLFFRIMKARNKRKTTLITTNLGFGEWGTFLKNDHLTSALIDRLTTNCCIFNMKGCITIRPNELA